MKKRRLVSLPHIVHVGYHKTASTWLQVCVFPHLAGVRYGEPALRQLVANLATARDGQFFAATLRSALREVAQLPGGRALLSDEGLSGSLWAGYGSGPRNARRLHTVVPGAQIILFVRRQDEMLRSIYAQYVNEGGTRSLRDFVSGREIEGSRFSLLHLEYDHLVDCYVDLFGHGRVWVVPYEHLRARPDRFLGELCDVLETDLTRPVSRSRQNRSLSPPTLRFLRAWNRLFRASRFNSDPLVAALPGGSRVRALLQNRVDPVVRHAAWDPSRKRDAVALAELAAGFAESNQRLQRFCSHSLAALGYPLPRVARAWAASAAAE